YARHYRRMVPPLLQTLTFRSNNERHRPLIRALALIAQYADSQNTYYLETEDIPLQDVVSPAWREKVLHRTSRGEVRVNRISYEVCVFRSYASGSVAKRFGLRGLTVTVILMKIYPKISTCAARPIMRCYDSL